MQGSNDPCTGNLWRRLTWAGNIYSLCGLFGLYLSKKPRFYNFCPSIILILWFLVIGLHSVLEFLIEYFNLTQLTIKIFSLDWNLYWTVTEIPEMLELIIAVSALLFIWLNYKMMISRWQNMNKT